MSFSYPFRAGLRSLFLHWQIVLIAVMAALFTWLAHRSGTDLSGAAFASSIAVLVFLLPAAGLVGPYLISELSDAVSLLANAGRADEIGSLRTSVQEITDAAKPLQRGFVYTTLAVLVSALALVKPPGSIKHFAVADIFGPTAIALLANTALCVYPITWNLLQMKAVKILGDVLVSGAPEAQTASATVKTSLAATAEGEQEAAAAADSSQRP